MTSTLSPATALAHRSQQLILVSLGVFTRIPVRPLLFTIFAATAATLAGTPSTKPTSVTIVDVPAERRDYGISIGNVKVRFIDGHTELWSKSGKCLMPQVSRSGHVGWTRFVARNDYQEPVNDVLRVRFPDGRVRDFRSCPSGPFIEQWAFADDDSTVIIKSRGRHGPAYYVKYDLSTGRLIGSDDRSTDYHDLPKWAQPYAD